MPEPVDTAIIPRQLLTRFFSLRGLYVKTLTGKVIDKLIAQGYDTPDKIFSLTGSVLVSLQGLPSKTIGKLLIELENAKYTTLPRLLYALGFPGSDELRYQILRHHSTWYALVWATDFSLSHVEGLTEANMSDIRRFFSNTERNTLVQRLRDQGVHWDKMVFVEDSPFSGKHVVVTGRLQYFNRKEVKEILLSQGAIFMGSISNKADYLIVGEKPGSKLTKARELKIQIVDENTWWAWTGFVPPVE